MAKVSELKNRARELEQQGEWAKAQAIYEHILRHLEGTPALKAELPLYVKVGDLALKLGDARSAVAMYDRAAEHYARAGSAKSCNALAEKIRRADPTQDDAAVRLGKALLAEGHAGPAAQVITRYAQRLGRTDVEDVLAGTDGDPETARRRVEQGLALLAAPPGEPMRQAEVDVPEQQGPRAEPEPPSPPPPPAREHIASSMADMLGGVQPVAPPTERARAEAPKEPSLIIEHGAAHPQVSPAVPPAPEAAAEAELGPGREPRPPAPEPELPRPAREPEPPAEPVAARAPEPTSPPEPEAEPEPEPEPEPAARAERPAEREPESEYEVSLAPGPVSETEPASPHRVGAGPRLLLRQPQAEPRAPNRARIASVVAVIVVLSGVGVAWALGWLPRVTDALTGGDGSDGGAAPLPATTPPATTAPGARPDSLAGDTTVFGPLGFHQLVDSPDASPAVAPGAAPDSMTTPVPAPPRPPPTVMQPVLPTVVVPPGHAIADQIVVIPGLRVVSVAETRIGGALGHRVVQQADGGIEIRLVATPGNFGADTVGLGAVQIETEGDTVAVGSVRLGRYLVDARAAMPAQTLAAYLRQVIRARPVN